MYVMFWFLVNWTATEVIGITLPARFLNRCMYIYAKQSWRVTLTSTIPIGVLFQLANVRFHYIAVGNQRFQLVWFSSFVKPQFSLHRWLKIIDDMMTQDRSMFRRLLGKVQVHLSSIALMLSPVPQSISRFKGNQLHL